MTLENSIGLSQQPWLSKASVWLSWLFIAIVIVAPRVSDLDVFYARDELAIWPWADEFTLAVWRGDPAVTLTASDYPGIPMFWVQTLFLTFKYSFPTLFPQTAIPLESLTKDRSIELLAERRLAAGLLISLQLIAAVLLVRQLFGWRVAVLSAILLGLDPFSLSEARLLRLEMISALFVCLSLLAYLLYLRRRGYGWLLLSGIMAGLSVSSKTSAGLIVPFIWLLLLLDFLLVPPSIFERGQKGPWLKKFRQMIGNGLIWAVGAMGAFWLIWPAMWVRPMDAIQHIFLTGFFQAADRSVWGDKVFFWGQVIEGGDPGPWFYPVALAFRTTPLMWLGLATALWVLVSSILTLRKSKNHHSPFTINQPWPATAVGLLLTFVILVTIELTLIVSKVDRFLLLIFPILDILSAIGLAALIEYASRLTPHASERSLPVGRLTYHALSAALLLIILVAQLVLTFPAHPYYFTYWNPWTGGARAAVEVLPIGSGEGIDQAIEFLNSQPDASEAELVCGASEPWCQRLFKGETMRSASYFDSRWVEADYVSFYISHLQRQNYPPEVVDFFQWQTPFYQVSLNGVTYFSVYAVPKMAHFAGRANDLAGLGRLLGYTLTGPNPSSEELTAKPGESVKARVWWTNLGAGVDNLVLRWVDETGYEWGRAKLVPRSEYAALAPSQRAIVVSTASLTIPPGTPPGLYFLRMGITAPGEERLLGEFKLPDEANKLVVIPGPIFSDPQLLAISKPLNQTLTPEVTLLGYDPPAQALTAAVPTWLILYWQATAKPANYLVTLRLLDSAGQEVTRWQDQPGHGHYPMKNWQAGEIVKDVWVLQVPTETPVGNYSLEISLTDPDNPKSPIPNPQSPIPNLEVWPQPIHYEAPEMQAELGAQFGEHLILLGYDLFFDTGGAIGGRLAPVFYWQSLADFEETFDLVLTLRNADPDQVVKEWRLPLGTGEAKTLWKAGEVIETTYPLDIEATVTGRYHLDLALQNRATGHIEPVRSDEGVETMFVRIENIQDRLVVRVSGQ